MPLIKYLDRKFSKSSRAVIEQANAIIAEYAAQGYDLTLRQLYYQFVSRDFLPNNMKSYKRLGSIINDARLAGLIDWEHITDRTRNLVSPPSWSSPEEIVSAVADQFRIDKWSDQIYRPEVWIEKEALAGVFERVCRELQVPYFCCRGYTSQSEMWVGGRRFRRHARVLHQTPLILHFGDHDPSGIDMTRDITERLEMFMGGMEVRRLALNMDQVQQYEPPPNPAKMTDSRAEEYVALYGEDSWELDALDPDTLAALVRDTVMTFRDQAKWDAKVAEEDEHKRLLGEVSRRWDELTGGL